MAGDAAMLKEFYYRYYSLLMQICSRYAGNREDAEQWVHDAFLKIFSVLPAYRAEGAFEGWLRRITVRLCIDHIRRQQTRRFETEHSTIYPGADLDGDAAVENAFLQKATVEAMAALLAGLPAKQRAVFNLFVFEEYSHREIAAELGISETHSCVLLHGARKQLRAALEATIPLKKEKHARR